MNSNARHILEAAQQLTPEEKEWLVECLLADAGEDTPEQVEAAWEKEIARRLDEIDSGKAEMVPLEDVLARMDARLRARKTA